MKKIPTLFVRDFDTGLLTPEVTPGCEWVTEGEGVATRKWDGSCCLLDKASNWWRRYDAKHGKTPPPEFRPAQPEADPITGHWPGWVPIDDSPACKYHKEAIEFGRRDGEFVCDWTYELCGPKVGKNPEGFPAHRMIRHGQDLVFPLDTTFGGLREFFEGPGADIEGIVWWSKGLVPTMCKIKLKDFGLRRRPKEIVI